MFLALTITLYHSDQYTDQREDSGILQKFLGSHQTILFTLFAVLASTAFTFLGKVPYIQHRGPLTYKLPSFTNYEKKN